MTNHFLMEDLENIKKSKALFSELEGKTVYVTGATGLIGSLLVRALLSLEYNIKIIALVRNIDKAKEIFKNEYAKVRWIKGDILSSLIYDEKVDYIFHCASVTTSKTMIERPVETIMTAIQGTKNVLELAKIKNVKSMVYVSSMEMYGSFNNHFSEIYENDSGYLNPLEVRSNYPESKRMCENLCIAYLSEYKVPVKIARLAQVFGAGVLKGENRVFAQFARSVIKEEDIVLHTKGKSEGNYCYSRDAIKALLLLLLKGNEGEAYNIVNPNSHITIAEMAQMVCDNIAKGKIKVRYDIPSSNQYGYATDTKMKLSADKMMRLGWKPEVGLQESYERLIGSLKCDEA